ncbi:MAG: hypothetical protein JWN65_4091 [Solirubrobacterales bacterium]|nr:hypothetical protein [Solirubrobacterales bacterium]
MSRDTGGVTIRQPHAAHCRLVRSFGALSDHDFELLIGDLLSAELGVRYELFARGPDGGIDLRHIGDPKEGLDIVQCKHYVKSTFGKLERDARREREKVEKLDPRPRSYRFVTSQGLTVKRKAALREALTPFVASEAEIYGLDDLDVLLNAHPAVERQHVKLWLTGGAQIDALLRAGTFNRSRQLLEETRASLGRYVQSRAYFDAHERLHAERVVILAGPPGIGKTTLARMLMADAALQGYTPVEISGDIEEGNDIFQPDEPQMFYYDDFLGSTFLLDRLRKNEDKRLAQFLRRVSRSKTHLLVLTTREHILRQATELYEHWQLEGIEARRFLLELPSYSRMDRARIFYNHVWESGQLDERARRALVAGDGYGQIIDHPNYNPRLIEHITGLASQRVGNDENAEYLGFAVGVLDNPDLIWRHAFEHQLDDRQRAVLVALASMPTKVTPDDLESAFGGLSDAGGRAFRRALRVLDDSFVSTHREVNHTFVEPINPSIDDFVASWLVESPDEVARAIDGAMFFAQLQWFRRSVVDGLGAHRGEILERLADATMRLFGSRDPGWEEIHWFDEDESRLGRSETEPTARLDWIVELAGVEPTFRRRLGTWFDQTLSAVSAAWRAEHVRDAARPVALTERLIGHGLITDQVLDDVKFFVSFEGGLSHAYRWQQALRLREVDSELFSDEEWTSLVARFRDWATGTLEQSDIADEGEVDEIATTAQRFGVELDDDMVSNAGESARQMQEESRRAAQEERASRQLASEANVPPRPTAPDDPSAVRALFGRLDPG